MAATGRYTPKRTILGIVSFFSSSTFRFRIRLVSSFYNGKIPTLTFFVLVLADIISGLSPLEIRSSCLFIYFLSVPESSSLVSIRMVLILVSVACWLRNRSSFIIFFLMLCLADEALFIHLRLAV